jgi:Outer membrane efflux protein
VLAAFQNVADALRAIQNDADAVKASADFERAAKISLDLAQQQMQAGNANVLLLLNAQVTYEQAVIQLVQAQANRVSDTAALFQALGGGWWNRIEPPAPELKLDVATGQAYPVTESGNWLSTVFGGGWWNSAEAAAPQPQKTEVAKVQSKPPTDEGTWSVARLLKPFGVADNQSQNAPTQGAAAEGNKP